MLDTPMTATRVLRLDQRARCYEEVMLEVDVENEMTFLTFDPPVTSKSVGQADTCIDLVLSSTTDATLSVFDESDVQGWSIFPVGPLSHTLAE